MDGFGPRPERHRPVGMERSGVAQMIGAGGGLFTKFGYPQIRPARSPPSRRRRTRQRRSGQVNSISSRGPQWPSPTRSRPAPARWRADGAQRYRHGRRTRSSFEILVPARELGIWNDYLPPPSPPGRPALRRRLSSRRSHRRSRRAIHCAPVDRQCSGGTAMHGSRRSGRVLALTHLDRARPSVKRACAALIDSVRGV